jgi:hypothetical protein
MTQETHITEELIVDEIQEEHNCIIGSTTSFDKIHTNLDRISYDFYMEVMNELEKNNRVTTFTTVGRFIVFIDVDMDFCEFSQYIVDTKNNAENAIDIANHLFHDNPDYFKSFMKQFNILKDNYKKNYHQAELLVHYSLIERRVLKTYIQEVVN